MVFLILICSFTRGVRAEPFRGPWEGLDIEAKQSRQAVEEQVDNSLNPLRWLVEFHRNYISPIDGKNCPMYPSCSEYSLRSFKKHGFFIGWFMTCDRLLHERDEMRKAPVIYINGEERLYDPLENNDFWWQSER